MNTLGNHNISIAILGIGGIGGLLASLFWKNGFMTTCIVRPNNVAAFIKTGIHLKSKIFGDFVAWPKFVSQLDSSPDILFITTKTNNLLEAVDSLPTHLIKNSIVVPLLNGIEHIELLRERFGKNMIVGMIGMIEAKKEESGVITHTSPIAPKIEIASRSVSTEMLQKIAEALKKLGINIVIMKNEKEVIWRKLVRVNAIACLTASYNQPLGFIRDHLELRQKLESCVREGALIARADGVDLYAEDVIRQIDALPASTTSSLQRDIACGKDSELEAIPGAVLRCAERYKIPCPTIKEIYEGLLLKTNKK